MSRKDLKNLLANNGLNSPIHQPVTLMGGKDE